MADSMHATLPPLHVPDLPPGNIQLPPIHELFADLDELTRQGTFFTSPQPCQLTSSPLPSQSSPIPHACLHLRTNTASTSTSTTTPIRRFRLVLTSHENADAVMLVTPSANPNTHPPQPLLLVGPALQKLRQGQHKLEKGTRVYPYRICRYPSDRRTSSGLADAKA